MLLTVSVPWSPTFVIIVYSLLAVASNVAVNSIERSTYWVFEVQIFLSSEDKTKSKCLSGIFPK